MIEDIQRKVARTCGWPTNEYEPAFTRLVDAIASEDAKYKEELLSDPRLMCDLILAMGAWREPVGHPLDDDSRVIDVLESVCVEIIGSVASAYMKAEASTDVAEG